MQTYISLLRGINVGGQKMIKMDALRQLYASLQLSSVQTYIQSGNVVFACPKTNCSDLEVKISQQIEQTFGFMVPVIVKTLEELKTDLNNNPFATQQDVSKLHLTFLSQTPEHHRLALLQPTQYAPDQFIIAHKTIYLFCPNGYGNTKLSNNFFETKLKLQATTRNWKTANVLLTMAEQI